MGEVVGGAQPDRAFAFRPGAGMLQLPMTAVLLTTLFFGANGIKVMPVVIVAVVVSFVLSKWLAGPPPAPKVPEPEEAAVPPASPLITPAFGLWTKDGREEPAPHR